MRRIAFADARVPSCGRVSRTAHQPGCIWHHQMLRHTATIGGHPSPMKALDNVVVPSPCIAHLPREYSRG